MISVLDPQGEDGEKSLEERNVMLQLTKLQERSKIVREAVSGGDLQLIGAMLDLSTGMVRFLSD